MTKQEQAKRALTLAHKIKKEAIAKYGAGLEIDWSNCVKQAWEQVREETKSLVKKAVIWFKKFKEEKESTEEFSFPVDNTEKEVKPEIEKPKYHGLTSLYSLDKSEEKLVVYKLKNLYSDKRLKTFA